MRAVSAWAAFGAVDWDSLVTRETGGYEPGLFDVRADPPRATPLAELVRELAAGREPIDPVLASPGWWERPERLTWSLGPPVPLGCGRRQARPPVDASLLAAS